MTGYYAFPKRQTNGAPATLVPIRATIADREGYSAPGGAIVAESPGTGFRYFLIPTANTVQRFGLACPTYLRYRVRTYVLDIDGRPTIVGIPGSVVDTYAIRPEFDPADHIVGHDLYALALGISPDGEHPATVYPIRKLSDVPDDELARIIRSRGEDDCGHPDDIDACPPHRVNVALAAAEPDQITTDANGVPSQLR